MILRTLMITLSLLLLVEPSHADDRDKLLGTWKLVSAVDEDVATKERKQVYGAHPDGYMVFTPDRRVFVVLTPNGLPQANQKPALISTSAYAGKYSIEGNKLIIKVDATSNEAWKDTYQEQLYRIDDNKLYIETEPFSAPSFGGSMVRGILVWESAN